VRGVNHSPASAKVKNEWSYISTPPLRFVECTGTYFRVSAERYFQVDGAAANETSILLNIQPVFHGEDLSKVCKGAELVNFRISRYEPDC